MKEAYKPFSGNRRQRHTEKPQASELVKSRRKAGFKKKKKKHSLGRIFLRLKKIIFYVEHEERYSDTVLLDSI